MLILIIYTWEPKRRNAVIKRLIGKGPLLAEGESYRRMELHGRRKDFQARGDR